MHAPARNENNRIIQSWEFNSSDTAVPAAVALPFALKCCVELFWNSFNFWPGPSAESQVKFSKMDLFCINRMAPYGVVFQLLALVQCSARAHYLYAAACYCLLPCDIAGSLSVTLILSLPGWLPVHRRPDCKPEWPSRQASPELDCLMLQLIKLELLQDCLLCDGHSSSQGASELETWRPSLSVRLRVPGRAAAAGAMI